MRMKSERTRRPRYNHLLEVLDGAASLHMAIRYAEAALLDPDLGGRERSMLESALEISRERHERVREVLTGRMSGDDREQSGVGAGHDAAAAHAAHPSRDDERAQHAVSEQDLRAAARAADDGSEESEQVAVQALDLLARSLKLEAHDSIEPLLAHSSPALRASAIKVLALHWRMAEYTDRVIWSLVSDADPECRRVAALALASLYEGTADRLIGRELVRALKREDEEPEVRWASYYALLALEGTDAKSRPLPVEDFDPSIHVDAGLTERYSDS